MEGEAPCSDRCLDVSRRIEGGGFVVGFRLRPGQFGIGDGGCLGACLVVGAQDGDIDMLDGSWLHGFQVCGPASVANFRDDAGLGRVCFGASAAAVEGRGRRADHEALIAKRLVPPALPSEILEGCCHIIDKDLSVSILSSAIQPACKTCTCRSGPHTAPFIQKQPSSHLNLACNLSLSLFSSSPLPRVAVALIPTPFCLFCQQYSCFPEFRLLVALERGVMDPDPPPHG